MAIDWAQKGKNYEGSKVTAESVKAAKKAAKERTAMYNKRMKSEGRKPQVAVTKKKKGAK